MRVSTPRELGALVRETRRNRGMSQEELARAVGVTRQWVIGLEQGRAGDFGATLRTLRALGLAMEVSEEDISSAAGASGEVTRTRVDLDELLSRFDQGRP